MTPDELEKLLPLGAVDRAVARILANHGKTVETVGFDLESMRNDLRDALLAALFADRTPFLVRDPRENPRHGDMLELDGSCLIVGGVLSDYAIVTIEDVAGNEVTTRPTRDEFRRDFAGWHVVRVAEYSTRGEP